MIRPFRAETLRYGHYSVAGEFVYDHPFQWGSKRTGPDLHRVGGKYSDEWHRIHLNNPRDVVPESNMPAYPVAGEGRARSGRDVAPRMKALRTVGVPTPTSRLPRPATKSRARPRWMPGGLPAGLGPRTQVKELNMDVNTLRIVPPRWSALSPSSGSWPGPGPASNKAGFDEAARLPFEQD
jgi:cbb3-type cytochrome c oxidase subunit II